MGFQSQLKKDQYHFIIQLTKTTLPLLSSTAVQAAIPRPKGDHVQVSVFNMIYALAILHVVNRWRGFGCRLVAVLLRGQTSMC